MREEIPRILQQHLSPSYGLSLNQKNDTSRGRAYQLCFINQLPKKIFTFSKIIAEDGAPLKIELHDTTYHNHIVNEEGSLLKIQVCVLNGDFGSNNGNEKMTKEEFNAKTLRPREGKGPLLNGDDTFVTLKNGVGYITKKIVFSDNSSWTRSGMFRLGVKVVQSTFIGVDIREGTSEPFKVKDNRGEVYKKHDCPSLNDEVWRLKRIAKDSKIHKNLSSNNINNVKDLLRLYITNQASLKEIIGNIPRKSWDTIIEHAKACNIDDDDKLYVYHWFSAQKSVSIVFNCIYKVVEVSFNWPNFRSIETLTLDEKVGIYILFILIRLI
ncbi:putative CALMODULIN-BINDING PROTEIN60 [Lupinus albus]|uniref:Putative CALMODULIN-BINDING PROTEIN60 n=1 Tax=Lupinus albus TaxID=3870 RepID=A0A6A4P033_LUPAL|nr:putative CALMODULIN-BINDING PROTEIN60 [Lupinus albus]